MSVCVSVHISDIIVLLHLSPLYDVLDHKTIYFIKAYHLVMTMIETKIQIQRQRHTDKDKYKVLPRSNVCYFFQKGVQGLKSLYWLSSCDEKDKDKDKNKDTIL